MNTYTLKNLDCANCALKIETHLKSLPGVSYASVDFSTLTLQIDTNDFNTVEKAIHHIEPSVELMPGGPLSEAAAAKSEINHGMEISIIIVSSILTITGFFFHRTFHDTPYHFLEFIVIFIAYGISGYKVLINALRTAFFGRMFDENILMTIATLGAIAIHQLPEAASVMVFYKIGDLLQRLALQRSRKSIASLKALRPDQATVFDKGAYSRVAPETVRPGQTIIVKAGERIPLDGIIISGEAAIDASALTGEHLPQNRGVNDAVAAGSINLSGVLTIRVTDDFSHSSLSRIMELTQNALHKKARTEQFITAFARWYTPSVVAVAALIAVLPPLFIPGALFFSWFHRALVLLVISCPCAFVISIPLGYFGGIGAASKKGILVKGANVFDDLVNCTTMVFDKTGTLTKGILTVTGIIPCNGYSADQILSFAATAQAHSHHPIAVSIVRHYGKHVDAVTPGEYAEIPGLGVITIIGGKRIIVGNDRLMHRENISHPRCSFDSTVAHVAVDGRYAGYITIGDRLKEGAAESIVALRRSGITNVHMVTGDNLSAAVAIATRLGIENVHADLLPSGKLDVMEKLLSPLKRGPKVAFVGDGINDAPVLARADIGIAMGDGSDAAIETSDIVIMSGALGKVAEAIAIARSTRAIVRQNIILAFAVKGFFIALGILGIATMWEAVFADMGVALCAIFNATRLTKGTKAGDEDRTRNVNLGKVALYH